MNRRRAPGQVRDAIVGYLHERGDDAEVAEIRDAVNARIGPTSASSVRSYLRLNTPSIFMKTERGRYKLVQYK